MANPNLPIGGQYNVYYGARYVPLIMGVWSSTVAYEPLSIVTYEGNSFTSRTFVPAGTLPTNETYWAATGNYNAQVEQYRQEVKQLEKQIANIPTIKENPNYLLIGGGALGTTSPIGTWTDVFVASNNIQTGQYYSLVNQSYGLIAANTNNTYDYLINTVSGFVPDYIIIAGDDYAPSYAQEQSYGQAIYNLAKDISDKWPNAITLLLVGEQIPVVEGEFPPKFSMGTSGLALAWNGYANNTLTNIGARRAASIVNALLTTGIYPSFSAQQDLTTNGNISVILTKDITHITVSGNFSLTGGSWVTLGKMGQLGPSRISTHSCIAWGSGGDITPCTLNIQPDTTLECNALKTMNVNRIVKLN